MSDNSLLWYHTFFVKNGKLVHDDIDVDLELNGIWCHNDAAETIRKEMAEIKGSTILDAGTCTGFFSCLFEDMGATAFSSDIADRVTREMIKKSLSQEDRFIHDNIYQLHNCESISEPFDYVWCQDVFCHLEHPILALRNIRSVCKKKVFIGTDRIIPDLTDIEFQHRWPDVDVNSICHYYNSVYTYSYSEPFLKKILNDCGFTDPKIKFSYLACRGKRHASYTNKHGGPTSGVVGTPTKKEMQSGGRWIDVYEATVDPQRPGFPDHKRLDWNGHGVKVPPHRFY